MKTYKVIQRFNTEHRLFRLGEVTKLDDIAARVLLACGVVELLGDDVGPTETKPVGPSETKPAVEIIVNTEAWVSRAVAAIKSGNGNTIRQVLAEVGETSNLKAENERLLQIKIDELSDVD